MGCLGLTDRPPLCEFRGTWRSRLARTTQRMCAMSELSNESTSSWLDFPDDDLPFSEVRGELPGIGGVVKQQVEDFDVEEIPAYEPVGEGEHLFLWIEKRDLSSEQLTWQLARALGISSHDIGMAGIKDRRAISRQYVSVPAHCEDRLARIADDRVRVLRACRHRNKLRRGHVRGNRFSILVRAVRPEAHARATEIACRLGALGFPNYYGSQRFGVEASTLATGYALLTGAQTPRDLPPSRRRFLLCLSLSAVQSHLFNLALAVRIQDHLLRCVLVGDVMQVVATGGRFVAEDLAREQPRYESGETVVTGPIFGPAMLEPSGEPAARESRLLERRMMHREMFDRFPKLTAGTRRPMLVWPQDLSVQQEPEGLRFRFALPSGTYATSLLREFI